MQDIIKKADVLIEALPYIRAFHKKTTVIKYGGSILGEDKIREDVLEDIVFLRFMGLRPILVHGGGPNISERLKSEGKKTQFVDGMRVTDAKTLKIVEEELNKLNDKIVKEIEHFGAKAVGLSGKNRDLILVEKKKAKKDLGLVGHIKHINAQPIRKFQEKGLILVICPMGRDRRGGIYNINADEVASSLAGTLKAEKLVLLTNVQGVMRHSEDRNSLFSTLNSKEARRLIREKVIQHGMIPKVKACITALNEDVKKTHIINARIPHALLLEIFTDEGIGTEIIK